MVPLHAIVTRPMNIVVQAGLTVWIRNHFAQVIEMNIFQQNLIVTIAIFILTGCQRSTNYENSYTLQVDSSMEIPLREESRNLSLCIQYFVQNGRHYLATINEIARSVEIYNVGDSTLENVIRIVQEGENALFHMTGFVVGSLDSVYVLTPMPKMIGLVNGKGEVQKIYSYNLDSDGRETVPTIGTGTYMAILNDSILFLNQEYRFHQSQGIMTDSARRKSRVCVALNTITGICNSFELTYPEELTGRDVSGMKVIRILGYKDTFIYNFGIVNALFLTTDHLNFTRHPIETNYGLKFNTEHWKYISDMLSGMKADRLHDRIINLIYDTYRECYYIVVKQREKDGSESIDLMTEEIYPHCFIVILDKSLKHMGEVFLPDNHYSCQMMFVAPEGLYISEDHPNNPDFDEDFMRFRLFILKKL
jgi:hypothetical protein